MTETENEDTETETDNSAPVIPRALAEELARIIARALVADYRADLLKSSAVPATANCGNTNLATTDFAVVRHQSGD